MGAFPLRAAAALTVLLLSGTALGAGAGHRPPTRDDLRRLDAAVAAHPDSLSIHLARLRVLHRLAVEDEGLLPDGDAALATAREARATAREATPAGLDPALLQAYRGAFRLLRAKHAAWPLKKREHLREGLPDLDSAVAARPGQAEIRWLRLVSCVHLPAFLGRKGSVAEDFAALARLLPAAREAYPPAWYLEAARFVLEKGKPKPEDRAALEAAVAQASAGDGAGS